MRNTCATLQRADYVSPSAPILSPIILFGHNSTLFKLLFCSPISLFLYIAAKKDTPGLFIALHTHGSEWIKLLIKEADRVAITLCPRKKHVCSAPRIYSIDKSATTIAVYIYTRVAIRALRTLTPIVMLINTCLLCAFTKIEFLFFWKIDKRPQWHMLIKHAKGGVVRVCKWKRVLMHNSSIFEGKKFIV